MNIYEKFGIDTIINAAGTLTRLGGSVMLPEARDAMSEAANALVPIDQLQSAASTAIAGICGSESGYVTSGASAGLTLATAACMVGLDIVKMDQLPLAPGGRNEVIICRPHRNSYDHAYRAAGATLVEVGMSDRSTGVGVRETEIWEIEAAITERTAAIAYTASAYSYPALDAVCAMARPRGIPVIVDAAGQLPPPSNLRRFISDGADLVSFSGGKAIRGPQGTGILAGRRDLIASVALQQLDMDVTFELWTPPPNLIDKNKLIGAPRHGVGRGYKVSKEQIVGLLVALERFTDDQARQDYDRWNSLLMMLERGLEACQSVRCTFVPPRFELGYPLLEIHLDEHKLGIDACAIAARLKDGKPPIYVGERKLMEGSLLIHPFNLDRGTAAVLLERLLGVLS